MEEHIVSITAIEKLTHDVRRYTVTKPEGYKYIPGQATELSINSDRWRKERRPFTFTSLNEWPQLEFSIKSYSDHEGLTDALAKCRVGDELLLHDVWGAIHYAGEGVFLAGGAGVTPFIAILRQLERDGKLAGNRLIFSNKTSADIILREEFSRMLGDRFIPLVTDEKEGDKDGVRRQKIDRAFLKQEIGDWNQFFYLCGPDPMVESLQKELTGLGAPKKNIIVEEF